MTVSVTINGTQVQVPEGASVLDAVNASNTYLSQLVQGPGHEGHRGLSHLPGAG